VSCGGHPLPIVVRADGTTEHAGVPGTLLGLIEHPELTDTPAELRSGDTIVLYTDGLTEAGAPEQVWTPEEIADAARGAAGAPPADTVSRLLAATVDGVPSPRDDVAVLALRAD
jgi:serine phosphatase RsbU (regulator of sigma subunit)